MIIEDKKTEELKTNREENKLITKIQDQREIDLPKSLNSEKIEIISNIKEKGEIKTKTARSKKKKISEEKIIKEVSIVESANTIESEKETSPKKEPNKEPNKRKENKKNKNKFFFHKLDYSSKVTKIQRLGIDKVIIVKKNSITKMHHKYSDGTNKYFVNEEDLQNSNDRSYVLAIRLIG